MSQRIRVLAVAIGTIATPATLFPQSGDEQAVREVVQLYFDGVTRNDSVALRRAFSPDARLMFVRRDSSLYVTPFEQWIAFTRERPTVEGKTNRIVMVDIAGDAAVAKTDLLWPGIHYVDYLSLLRVGGEWRIVHKIWWQEPR